MSALVVVGHAIVLDGVEYFAGEQFAGAVELLQLERDELRDKVADYGRRLCLLQGEVEELRANYEPLKHSHRQLAVNANEWRHKYLLAREELQDALSSLAGASKRVAELQARLDRLVLQCTLVLIASGGGGL